MDIGDLVWVKFYAWVCNGLVGVWRCLVVGKEAKSGIGDLATLWDYTCTTAPVLGYFGCWYNWMSMAISDMIKSKAFASLPEIMFLAIIINSSRPFEEKSSTQTQLVDGEGFRFWITDSEPLDLIRILRVCRLQISTVIPPPGADPPHQRGLRLAIFIPLFCIIITCMNVIIQWVSDRIHL